MKAHPADQGWGGQPNETGVPLLPPSGLAGRTREPSKWKNNSSKASILDFGSLESQQTIVATGSVSNAAVCTPVVSRRGKTDKTREQGRAVSWRALPRRMTSLRRRPGVAGR
jgi:hypothetical protein